MGERQLERRTPRFCIKIAASHKGLPRRGGRWWIRTTEATCNRFTVCPLWPLGKSPKYKGYSKTLIAFFWSWWTDLNPRPADYKSAALPTELHQRIQAFHSTLVYNTTYICFCQDLFSIFNAYILILKLRSSADDTLR